MGISKTVISEACQHCEIIQSCSPGSTKTQELASFLAYVLYHDPSMQFHASH